MPVAVAVLTEAHLGAAGAVPKAAGQAVAMAAATAAATAVARAEVLQAELTGAARAWWQEAETVVPMMAGMAVLKVARREVARVAAARGFH